MQRVLPSYEVNREQIALVELSAIRRERINFILEVCTSDIPSLLGATA
jgi:hypothetical protein